MFGIILTMNLACIILAIICDIAAINNGSKEIYRAGEMFSVTGHIISTDAKRHTISFWDRPDLLVVQCDDEMINAPKNVLYLLEGHLELGNGLKKLALAERLVPVETNSLPVPIDSSTTRIASRLDYKKLVRIEGTIIKVAEDETDLRYNWLTLKNTEGMVAAACLKEFRPIDTLTPLIGAKVRLIGMPMQSNTWRVNLPPALILTRHNPVEVLEPSEVDPTKLPIFTSPQVIGRQKIEGVVLAHGKDGFYITFKRRNKIRTIAFVNPYVGIKLPAVGDKVIVAGFASLEGYHLRFDEALIRTEDNTDQRIPEPEEISIGNLFTNEDGSERIALKKHGDIVQLRGTVRDLSPEPTEGKRIVIEDAGHRIGINAESIADTLPAWIENGAVIDATGMLSVEYEPASSPYAMPRFVRFTVLPRSAADLRLVRRAPWWTPRRLLVVILVLLGVIVWISLWNRALKHLSVKRGEELYRERIAHKAAELKVEERTRLAVEIHDSISQTLTGIALQFDNGANEAVVRQMLASCRHELKSCLWDLRSRTFEEKDMTEAIRRAIGPNAGGAKVDVRFNVPRNELSETTTHAILRIVRELVVNAVRHGKATEVKVAGECHDGTISFSVKDNGSGFDPASVAGPSTGHFGLQGVRERLNKFGGKMKIESKPGNGTKIISTLLLS